MGMKHIGKYLLLFITILLMGFTLSGCMTITQEDYLRAAERYMEKKYGEKFEGQYFGMNSGYLYVSPVNHPEWRVMVAFPKAKLWNVEFQDNYVAFLLKAEVEDAVEKIASEIYGDVKVYCCPIGNVLPSEWNRETTLEEFNTRNTSKLYLFLAGDESNKEKNINMFLEKYCEANFGMTIMEILYLPQEQLQALQERDVDRIFNEGQYFWRTHIVLKRELEFSFDEVKWREGDLQLKN